MSVTLQDLNNDIVTYAQQAVDASHAQDLATIDGLTQQLAADTALIAQLNGQVAIDATQLAALQAQIDALTPAKTIPLHDFGVDFPAQPGVALWVKSGKFGGTDLTKLIYQMPPNSSKKVNVTTGTTPYFMIMCGGGSANLVPTDLDVGGFTLDGTEQPNGLFYHGVRFGWSKGAKFHDAYVWGARGGGSTPPPETFADPWWHADGGTLTNVTLDGRDRASLTPVSATLYGGTNCDSATISGSKFNYANSGFGMALFQCRGTYDVRDGEIRYCRKAINIEKHQGGTVRYTNQDFRGTKAPNVAQVSTENGSTIVEFVDCLFDGDLCQVQTFGVNCKSSGVAWTNGQKNSDIRRIDKGKVITDPTKFLVTR